MTSIKKCGCLNLYFEFGPQMNEAHILLSRLLLCIMNVTKQNCFKDVYHHATISKQREFVLGYLSISNQISCFDLLSLILFELLKTPQNSFVVVCLVVLSSYDIINHFKFQIQTLMGKLQHKSHSTQIIAVNTKLFILPY